MSILCARQCAADCEFQCSGCDSSLTNYVLLRKLMSDLYSLVLREEVFCNFASFNDVDELHRYCTAFEVAHKDASLEVGGKASAPRESALAAATDPLPAVGDRSCLPEVAATSIRHPSKPRKCGKCGRTHLPRKGAWPAEKLVCLNCRMVGHLAVMGRRGKQAAAVEDL